MYAGVAFYHWGAGTLPHSIFTVFGFLDMIFLALFVLCLREMKTAGVRLPLVPDERSPVQPVK
jgi:hypothetical protein